MIFEQKPTLFCDQYSFSAWCAACIQQLIHNADIKPQIEWWEGQRGDYFTILFSPQNWNIFNKCVYSSLVVFLLQLYQHTTIKYYKRHFLSGDQGEMTFHFQKGHKNIIPNDSDSSLRVSPKWSLRRFLNICAKWHSQQNVCVGFFCQTVIKFKCINTISLCPKCVCLRADIRTYLY